jgi:hypothetical protein
MSAVELDTKKAVFVRDVLNEPNEHIISMLITYFQAVKKNGATPPCCFTPEELKSEIAESLQDVRDGRLTTHEQLEKEMMLW